MAPCGAKSLVCRPAWRPRSGSKHRAPIPTWQVAVALGVLLSAAVLTGCEYADLQEPAVSSTPPAPSEPGNGDASPSAEDLARQREMTAEVEAQLGHESALRVISMTGGMGRSGTSLMGLVPGPGLYLIRVACSTGPSATLTVAQAGSRLFEADMVCGAPRDVTLELTAGEVSATLKPKGRGEPAVAAMRLEKSPATP